MPFRVPAKNIKRYDAIHAVVQFGLQTYFKSLSSETGFRPVDRPPSWLTALLPSWIIVDIMEINFTSESIRKSILLKNLIMLGNFGAKTLSAVLQAAIHFMMIIYW